MVWYPFFILNFVLLDWAPSKSYIHTLEPMIDIDISDNTTNWMIVSNTFPIFERFYPILANKIS